MKIFVSHATKNKDIVLKFAEFLETINSDIKVFCSSEKGSVPGSDPGDRSSCFCRTASPGYGSIKKHCIRYFSSCITDHPHFKCKRDFSRDISRDIAGDAPLHHRGIRPC